MFKTIKLFLAAAAAFLVCNMVCSMFFNDPGWVARPCNATNAICIPHTTMRNFTEGGSVRTSDRNGYVNRDLPLAEDGCLLVMGSSQVKADEVGEGYSFCELLNEKLSRGDSKECLHVYSMGIDANYYPNQVSGFSSALAEFPGVSGVVLEIGTTDWETDELLASLEQRRFDPAFTGGCLGEHLTGRQKMKRLILTCFPLPSYLKRKMAPALSWEDETPFGLPLWRGREEEGQREEREKGTRDGMKDNTDNTDNTKAVMATLELLRSLYDGTIIILYHPEVSLNRDGSMSVIRTQDSYTSFVEGCRANNILFLDMGEAFLREYEASREVPYGFSNTSPGTGHLNRTGHRLVAEELYKMTGEV